MITHLHYRRSRGPLAALLLFLLSAPAVGQVGYVVVDLGLLPGNSASSATGINAAGDVVGAMNQGLNYTPFLYTDAGGTVALPIPTGNRAFAMAINDLGQVAMHTSYGLCSGIAGNAYRYTPGSGFLDLGSFAAGVAEPRGINILGQVAGASDQASCTAAPFLYVDGVGMTAITPGQAGVARAINDAGQVAGTGPAGGWRYDPVAGVQALGGLPAQPYSRGEAIDANGVVAGITTNGTHVAHLYRGTPGALSDLGQVGYYSRVSGMSPGGRIVGTWDDNASTPYGFLWDGALVDLNTLLVTPGWYVRDAKAINDAGQIVAIGWTGSQQPRAIRLDPVYNASTAPVGSGCGPDQGVLSTSAPVLGLQLSLQLSGVSTGAVVAAVLAAGPPMPVTLSPGCTVQVDLAAVGITFVAVTSGSGTASWTMPVPVSAQFAGIRLTGQAATFGGQLSLSNGVDLLLGM